jgi:hypothetical protein
MAGVRTVLGERLAVLMSLQDYAHGLVALK